MKNIGKVQLREMTDEERVKFFSEIWVHPPLSPSIGEAEEVFNLMNENQYLFWDIVLIIDDSVAEVHQSMFDKLIYLKVASEILKKLLDGFNPSVMKNTIQLLMHPLSISWDRNGGKRWKKVTDVSFDINGGLMKLWKRYQRNPDYIPDYSEDLCASTTVEDIQKFLSDYYCQLYAHRYMEDRSRLTKNDPSKVMTLF